MTEQPGDDQTTAPGEGDGDRAGLPSHVDEDLAGPRFAGPSTSPDDYELVAPDDGRAGGEGVIWKGLYRGRFSHPVLYALKRLHRPANAPAEWPDAKQQAIWDDQIRLMRLVRHPNLVSYHEMFVGPDHHPPASVAAGSVGAMASTDRRWWLVMGWVEGPSLHDLVRNESAPLVQRLEWLRQVADAIDTLHSGVDTGGSALFHNDIKPANILVNPSGHAVLVDCGLLRYDGDSPPTVLSFTPPYAAPEVHADIRARSAASDMWSLAATTYFALTGEHPNPFNTPVMRETLRRSLAALVTDSGAPTEHVMRVLEAPPADRPTAAEPWVRELRALLGAPVLASVAAPRQRRSGLLGVAAAVAIGAGAIGGYVFRGDNGDPKVAGAVVTNPAASSSVPPTTTIVGPPAAPTKPAVTVRDGKAYSIKWNMNASNGSPITKFRLNAACDGQADKSAEFDWGGEKDNTFDADEPIGQRCSYWVAAMNASGWGPDSPHADFVRMATPPDAPAAPTAVVGNGSAIVTVQKPKANGAPVDKYEVQITDGYAIQADATTSDSSSISVGSLTRGTQYNLRARAHNEAGWSTWSEPSGPVTPT